MLTRRTDGNACFCVLICKMCASLGDIKICFHVMASQIDDGTVYIFRAHDVWLCRMPSQCSCSFSAWRALSWASNMLTLEHCLCVFSCSVDLSTHPSIFIQWVCVASVNRLTSSLRQCYVRTNSRAVHPTSVKSKDNTTLLRFGDARLGS